MEKNHLSPDGRHAAVCGLFCASCSLFIASREDPERLARIAAMYRISIEDARCDGCRSDKKSLACSTCKFVDCAAAQGVAFCFECSAYPCETLVAFQAAAPHRIELWDANARIRQSGLDIWYAEMCGRYSCPSCGTINSAYDLSCRSCGKTPSCPYVSSHKEAVALHLDKRK